MKKVIPAILLLLGIFVAVGAAILVRMSKNDTEEVGTDEETVAEIPLEERPVVSLTPSEDGHWLTLKIQKIGITAETLDYELVYKVADGRNQGVPGTVKLASEGSVIERELLLGSESSGKYRYDEGVESGTLTLRFRNEQGKLVGKLSTEFILFDDWSSPQSADGEFTFEVGKSNIGHGLIMDTFGLPGGNLKNVLGPYGIFTKSKTDIEGNVEISGSGKVLWWDGDEWIEVDGESPIGIFVKTS